MKDNVEGESQAIVDCMLNPTRPFAINEARRVSKGFRLRQLLDNFARPRSKSDVSPLDLDYKKKHSTCTENEVSSANAIQLDKSSKIKDFLAPDKYLLSTSERGINKKAKSPCGSSHQLVNKQRSSSVSNYHYRFSLPDPSKLPRASADSVFARNQQQYTIHRCRKATYPCGDDFGSIKNSPKERILLEWQKHFNDDKDTVPDSGIAATSDSSVFDITSESSDFWTSRLRHLSTGSQYMMLRKQSNQTSGRISRMQDIDENYCRMLLDSFTCYDLMPDSSKLVVIEETLSIAKAFRAMVVNSVRACLIWNSKKNIFTTMLTTSDLMHVLNYILDHGDENVQKLENQSVMYWKELLYKVEMPLLFVRPHDSLLTALRLLEHNDIHRLPVIDSNTGNALQIVNHKRILQFLSLKMKQLPISKILGITLEASGIGCFNVSPVFTNATLSSALKLFNDKHVSLLPVLDEHTNQLVDIYSRFDCIYITANGMYEHLEISIKQALSYRNQSGFQVHRCVLNEPLSAIFEKLVETGVYRLVIVNDMVESNILGTVSISDLLKYLISERDISTCDSVCKRKHTYSGPASLSVPKCIFVDRRHSAPQGQNSKKLERLFGEDMGSISSCELTPSGRRLSNLQVSCRTGQDLIPEEQHSLHSNDEKS